MHRILIASWFACGLLSVLFMQDYIIKKDMEPHNAIIYIISGPVGIALDGYVYYTYIRGPSGTKSTLK